VFSPLREAEAYSKYLSAFSASSAVISLSCCPSTLRHRV
jgi:hypothetical protein